MSRQYCPWPDPTLTLPTLAARQQPTGAILLSLTAKWVLSVSTSSYLRLLPLSLFQLNRLPLMASKLHGRAPLPRFLPA